MLELPEMTKAWMAGFFEGEGSISVDKLKPRWASPRYILNITVSNTVYSGIECFGTYFGGCTLFLKTEHRPYWRWQAQGKTAMRFLETLLPYFRIKQKQAELAILFQKKIRPQRGTAPMPQAYLVERERIRQAIQELNGGWPTPTVIDVESPTKQLLLGSPYQEPEQREIK